MFLGQHGGAEQRENRERPECVDRVASAIKKNDVRRQQPENAERLRPADDVGDRFSLKRMQQEQSRRKNREHTSMPLFDARPIQNFANREQNQAAIENVQNHVDEVIAERVLISGCVIIQPEAEHEQRAQSLHPRAQSRIHSAGRVGHAAVIEQKRAVNGRPINLENGENCDQDSYGVRPVGTLRRGWCCDGNRYRRLWFSDGFTAFHFDFAAEIRRSPAAARSLCWRPSDRR